MYSDDDDDDDDTDLVNVVGVLVNALQVVARSAIVVS